MKIRTYTGRGNCAEIAEKRMMSAAMERGFHSPMRRVFLCYFRFGDEVVEGKPMRHPEAALESLLKQAKLRDPPQDVVDRAYYEVMGCYCSRD